MGFVSGYPVQETPNGVDVTFTTDLDFIGDVLITIGGLVQYNYTKDDLHTFTFDTAPTVLMGTILVTGYAGDDPGDPTLGPWSLVSFYSIYGISGDAFHPPRSDNALDVLIAYVMTDVIADVITAITQTVYDTYTTDFSFATKLKRCLAICTIQTLHLEHGLVLTMGLQLGTESITDFASVTYRYPNHSTEQTTFLSKPRNDLIRDLLLDYLPAGSPLTPASPAAAYGAFLDFEDVEDQALVYTRSSVT